jgi:tRNA nucleotidyltransferase (CCA-adding enzyme)
MTRRIRRARRNISGLTEWKSVLLTAPRPSVALQRMVDTGKIHDYPGLAALIDVPQDPHHHPEGDAWEHTKLVLDAAASLRASVPKQHRLAYMLAALLHDIGKGKEGVVVRQEHVDAGLFPSKRLFTAYGHDKAGEAAARHFMQGIDVDQPTIDLALALITTHMQPYSMVGASKKSFAKLAKKLEAKGANLRLLAALVRADKGGRGQELSEEDEAPILKVLEWAAILEKETEKPKAPPPLIQGKDLIALGYRPGPTFGRIMGGAKKLQAQGLNKEQILTEIQQMFPLAGKNPDGYVRRRIRARNALRRR